GRARPSAPDAAGKAAGRALERRTSARTTPTPPPPPTTPQTGLHRPRCGPAPNHSTTEKQRDTRRRTRHGRPDAAQGGSQAARTPRTRRRTGRRVAGPRGQLGLRRPPVGRARALRLVWRTRPRPRPCCRPPDQHVRLTRPAAAPPPGRRPTG